MIDQIYLIVMIVVYVATAVSMLIKIVHSTIKIKNAKSAEEIANQKNEINILVEDLMKQAEQFYSQYQVIKSADGKTGFLKKDFVLSKIERYCLNKGIPYDENEISEKIEKLVQFAKEINKK